MKPFDPLRELFEVYARHKLRGSPPGVLNQFRVTVGNLAKFLGREPRLTDLTDDTVLDAMYWLIDRGRAPGTANKLRANLLAMWRFSCRRGWLAQWPDAEKMREPERVPVAWTRDELRRVWEMCDSQTGKIAGVPAALWWHGVHSLMWDTSERITAARSLRRADTSLESLTVVFRAESRKGRRRDRLHPIHPATAEILRQIWWPERELLFPWPYCHSYVWIRYRLMLQKAGLPDDRLHKFHCVRKSVASYYEVAGGNATQLLDHSSRAVTVKHYLDPRITGTARPACELLFRPTG